MSGVKLDRQQLLKTVRAGPPAGLTGHQLGDQLGLDRKQRHRLRSLIAELVDEGVIDKAPGARYRLHAAPPQPSRPPASKAAAASTPALPAGQVAGRLRVHPAGYGFVERDDAEDDVFIPARYRGAALDGDRVAVSTWLGYKGSEGRVEAVLERGRAKLTGTLRGHGRDLRLEPDDPRIATSGQVAIEGGTGGAREGEAVVVEITQYPKRAAEPLHARVLRVLGDPDDPRTEVDKVIVCAELPDAFSPDAQAAAARTPDTVRREDLADRVDLRDRQFLTIDPETARDFDDAVCIEPSPHPGSTRLWVAVADVSHYVPVGSALDREARARGCSAYLPHRAIPMLPEALSSGICSLNPEVDRLAMVVRMEVDRSGEIHEPYFCAAVIRSQGRLDYPGVAAALAGDLRGARARYRPFLPALTAMSELSRRLRVRRIQRGALDFDLAEAKVILDDDDPRRVRDVVKSRASPEVKRAYQLVEDFMLAANETVARAFRERQLDTLWRVHDLPKQERLEALAGVAEAYGVRFDYAEGVSPKKLADLLASLRGRPAERPLNFLLLRSLKQAVYDVVNVGHFGLAARDYLHFTSPIRRYPDLIVHRLLKRLLHEDGLPAGGPPPPRPPTSELSAIAAESSAHERRAMEAEREVVDMYRAFLMRERIGEEYEAIVVGVTSFGLFVQIEAPFVEGLVRVESIAGGPFQLDEQAMRLVNPRTGRAFALGDPLRVRIENVSVPRRQIDMVLVGETAIRPPGPPPEAARPRAATGRRRGERRRNH